MLILVLIILTSTILYYLLKLNYQYWEKRKIPGPKPTLLVGNLGKVLTLKDSLGNMYTKIYKQFYNDEVVGIYRATSPVLIARDPELIKEITVKSFNNFRNNDIELSKKHDPLFGRNPFALKGDEWKIVRGQLTPGFTSGKMKWLYPLMKENCENLVKFIERETLKSDGYEAKEICMKFTLDNVATCAFGLQGKCLQEEDSHFRQLANDVFSPDGWGVFGFFIMMVYPPLTKYLPVRFIQKSVEIKLITMISQTLKYREDNNIIRNDFLHILHQLKKTCKDYEFTDIDVTAHAAGFFGDGFETSSIVMSFTMFELAANPEVQTKLREEINEAFNKDTTKISYEDLLSLQYLEASINESLRLHPPLFFLQKQCTKDFIYSPRNGNNSLVIEKGTAVVIPVYGFHTDSKYYDEPEKFIPERFIGSSKDNLTKYTFLPFGEGPRACLGQRFGLLQIKAGLAYIIKNYEISVNKKTKLPITYEVTNAMTQPVGGLWLNFKKIT